MDIHEKIPQMPQTEIKVLERIRIKVLSVVKIHINRIYFYLPVIYGISKVYQWSNDSEESCWQLLWNKI